MSDILAPSKPERVQYDNHRIVLVLTTGPHAGMHHILGCTSQMPDSWKAPELLMPVQFPPDGRPGAASLFKVTWRAIYYRELILPTSVKQREAVDGPKSFDPRQQ